MKREIITIDEYGRLKMPTDKNGAVADIWMSEAEIVELFDVTAPTIRAAINAVYKSGVLRENDTKRTIRQENGNSAEVYNLEVITALAFRIRSHGAAKLREYILRTLGTVNKQPTINILMACAREKDGCGSGQVFN